MEAGAFFAVGWVREWGTGKKMEITFYRRASTATGGYVFRWYVARGYMFGCKCPGFSFL